MTTTLRRDIDDEPETLELPAQEGETSAVPSHAPEGNLLACPACNQEMYSPVTDLPLHMAAGSLCIGSGSQGAAPKFGNQIVPPLTIADLDQLSISEILSVTTCLACARSKTPGRTLCSSCHGNLPFLQQKCLPLYIKGYLFSDETQSIAGYLTKTQFMDVFKAALKSLAELRKQKEAGE